MLNKNLGIFLIMIGIITAFFSQINTRFTSIQHRLSHFWTGAWKLLVFFNWLFLCLKLLFWTQYMHRIKRFGGWFIEGFRLLTTVVFSYWSDLIISINPTFIVLINSTFIVFILPTIIIFITPNLNCRFFENITLFIIILQLLNVCLLFLNTIKIEQSFLSYYGTSYYGLYCDILRSIFTLRTKGLSWGVFFINETNHWP